MTTLMGASSVIFPPSRSPSETVLRDLLGFGPNVQSRWAMRDEPSRLDGATTVVWDSRTRRKRRRWPLGRDMALAVKAVAPAGAPHELGKSCGAALRVG